MHMYEEETLAGVRGRFALSGPYVGPRQEPASPPRARNRRFRGRC
ncbi:hypothetical protein [Streptomyces sp. NPDC027717]